VIVSISLADSVLQDFAGRLDTTSRTAKAALSKDLNAAGFELFTDVRRALHDQMNTRSLAIVARHTKSKRAAPNRLEYTITGSGKGLLIASAFRFAAGGAVSSDPWNEGRTFKRSFRNGKRLMARLTGARYPVRYLYGPAPGKEIVKDRSLAVFTEGVDRIVRPRIDGTLRRLSGL